MKFIFNIILLLCTIPGFNQAKSSKSYFNEFIKDTLFRSAHMGVSVYDPAAEKFLHSYQADKYFIPASNTKIITCYAALKYLGDTITMTTDDTYLDGMGAGWAWDDFKEVEDPYPEIPFLDSGEIWSGPIDSLLRPMMFRSDNYVAEQTYRMVSRRNNIDSIQNIFFPLTPRPVWVDGCGLSRYNLFTPLHLIHVLDEMQKDFGMQRIKVIFPSSNEGTLKNYYLHDAGGIYAKTGSLTGVIALSGYLYTRQNKLLIFSVLVNNHNQTSSLIRRRIEKFIHDVRTAN